MDRRLRKALKSLDLGGKAMIMLLIAEIASPGFATQDLFLSMGGGFDRNTFRTIGLGSLS